MGHDLVEQAMAGDLEAFNELVRRRIDQLYAMARLILRDSEWAADATQAVVTSGEVIDAMIPRWSPDGTTLLCVRLDNSHLFTVPAAGGTSRDMGDPGAGQIWSPDGTQVAIFRSGPADSSAHLVVIDQGTGEVVLDVEAGDQSYPNIFHYPSWQRLAP